MCECICLHRCFMNIWARTITHITYIHTHTHYVHTYTHANVHGYTLAFREAQGAARTRVYLQQLAPLLLVSAGTQRRKGREVCELAPDPGPARLRPRDMEVSRRFVLASLGSTPSGHAVSIARTHLTNPLHSAFLLGLHNLLVTKLNHI